MPRARRNTAPFARRLSPRVAMRTMLVIAALVLPGCSDPEPGLTAAEFYSRAEATRERALGPGPNAWDELAAVLAQHESAIRTARASRSADSDPDSLPAIELDAVCLGHFPRPGVEGAVQLMDEMAQIGLFANLDRALAAQVIAQPWDTTRPVYDAFNAGFAHLGQIRGLGRTLRARLRVAAARGDAPQAVQAFQNQLALARAVAGRCLTIDYLVGVAASTMTLQEARHLALEEALTADMIRGMLAALESGPSLPPPDAILDTERDFSLATFVEGAKEHGLAVNRREWISRIESAHAAAAAKLAEPDRGRAATMADAEYFGAVLGGIASESELFALLDHSLAMVLDNERRLALDIAGTRAVLLVALHRAEQGRYPESLEEIGAPVDPVADMPFVLRLTPEAPGAPFLLYSVGADRTDNGGTERAGGMLAAPGPDDQGFDYIFTKARRPSEEPEAPQSGGPRETP